MAWPLDFRPASASMGALSPVPESPGGQAARCPYTCHPTGTDVKVQTHLAQWPKWVREDGGLRLEPWRPREWLRGGKGKDVEAQSCSWFPATPIPELLCFPYRLPCLEESSSSTKCLETQVAGLQVPPLNLFTLGSGFKVMPPRRRKWGKGIRAGSRPTSHGSEPCTSGNNAAGTQDRAEPLQTQGVTSGCPPGTHPGPDPRKAGAVRGFILANEGG